MIDSFDTTITMEELYDGVECDRCYTEVLLSNIHILESFKDKEKGVSLLLCDNCLNELKGELL